MPAGQSRDFYERRRAERRKNGLLEERVSAEVTVLRTARVTTMEFGTRCLRRSIDRVDRRQAIRHDLSSRRIAAQAARRADREAWERSAAGPGKIASACVRPLVEGDVTCSPPSATKTPLAR
jgi:hypothetical protein